MKVLAIDTSTWTASVALVDEHGAVIVEGEARTETHSENLLPLIASLCKDPRALDAVAVGVGPGSFTGLRIGLSTAKGIAFAAGCPLWAASSLAALALDLEIDGLRVPVLDARRGEIFAGFYRDGVAIVPERVMPPSALAGALADVRNTDETIALAGDALAVYPELAAIPSVITPPSRATPSAAAVARLALRGDRADILGHGAPVYIRLSEAEVKYPDGVPGAIRKR
ncbi:MAG TPA: tRNA (adenosine(37)-N6)-threonylcarbamoyltransferase complex dimerization subunit type 1 TsaB [Kofleriaceae bacterium]|nr:tRNA (adenosine(37)-N6)-threonylcarbamoyltransferase complex dimerization subunit type 1 TsaB [Kofleriaceae bacterium]